MNVHETIIGNEPSGKYPVALRDSVTLLIEEQPNMIPIYMSGTHINFLEARVKQAEKISGNMKEAVQEMKEDIDVYRCGIENMVAGMAQWGTYNIIIGTILGRDLESSEPAISASLDERFSFQLKPKKFNIGLTGRLLQNTHGEVLREMLSLQTTPYDLFDLAIDLSPKRIVAVNASGSQTVIHEDGKKMGARETFRQEKRKRYILHPESRDLFSPRSDVELLSTRDLEIIPPQEWEYLSGKYRGAWFVGYAAKNFKSLFNLAQSQDDHLFWRLAMLNRSENSYVFDAELKWGLRNKVACFPYHRNRLAVYPHKMNLHLGGLSIQFDQPDIYQALISLGDEIRDIWMNPRYREDIGWDVVYDEGRRISPQNPVILDTNEKLAAYQVILT